MESMHQMMQILESCSDERQSFHPSVKPIWQLAEYAE